MPFDYKKEYKEFYLPPRTPSIVTVPAMNFLAVRGQGDPNQEDGAYKEALSLLYAVAFTIKMSKLGKHKLEGYFDYVVPPLEGLWWQEGVHGVDYARKGDFQWISLIRLPEFVTEEAFHWAIREATEKKKQDFSRVEFFSWEEGLCVQCMHLGPYDDELATVAAMDEYARAQGYLPDFSESRFHHEIYLSDVRRCKPEKLKTVIRQPVRKEVRP
ncbi:GyrI-like domain-containing protein [Candidatus Allofournierella excrementavium]|uniref:GyrI-like domain-containing protein n=1 Tax=Candidatus Allofournierella excrementavium TaxID=2838591 RepID=UPI003AF59243